MHSINNQLATRSLLDYMHDSKLSMDGITHFQNIIYDYYKLHGRIFPWRYIEDPYCVTVSEIMLQQTQTHRVIDKYQQFITRFPDVKSLAQASLKDVLAVWQGLGYNRRAQSLQVFAQRIVTEFQGLIPNTSEQLKKFKGIGDNTAGSICAFAFNKPTVFIETNIRAVFIYFFFGNQDQVTDDQIKPFVEQTVDKKQPRDWYYALMDYGVMLKKLFNNPSKKSAHYTIQSKFEGSDRQIRGAILKVLLMHESLPLDTIVELLGKERERTSAILQDLVTEKLVEQKLDKFMLPTK